MHAVLHLSALLYCVRGFTGFLAAFSAAAIASEAPPNISFGGFATVGVVRSSQEQADFTSHLLQKRGAGRTQRWSPDVDSRLAGQVNAQLTSRLSGVVQMLVEQQYDGKYDPALEWANMKYQATPELALRVGRIVLPVFLMSDYRKVGYAQPWARPPVELYGLVPMSNSDGLHAMYRLSQDKLIHNIQFSVGKTGATLTDGGRARLDNGFLLADTMEYGPLTIHTAYARAKLTLESFRPLFNGYRAIANDPGVQAFFPVEAARAESIIAEFEPENRDTRFYGIGAMYDPGSWFLTAEAGRVASKSLHGNRNAWYLSSGYRFGDWTPYITYTQVRNTGKSSTTGVALPDGAVQAANAFLNGMLASIPQQNTITVGTRWDISESMALKLQYDTTRIGTASYGTLRNQAPGFGTGGTFRFLSATLDMVF